MSSAYAHITLVNLLRGTARLDSIPEFPDGAKRAVLRYVKFCELGAVSPDYPYLALFDSNAKKWADLMHYVQTVEMIRAGMRRLRQMQGEPQQKGLAWLLGYAAHVATDVAIHPVVQLRVGPYVGHEKEHRECEMHQDTYIFPRLGVGPIELSGYLESGVDQCGDPTDASRLDPDVEQLWRAMLAEVHPQAYNANQPDIHKWRHGFKLVVEKIASGGGRLMPCARHVAADLDLMYPAQDQIDMSYIRNLRVPGGGTQDYDAIFDWAIDKVGSVWQMVARGVLAGQDEPLAQFANWNLDTGCEEKLVFWS